MNVIVVGPEEGDDVERGKGIDSEGWITPALLDHLGATVFQTLGQSPILIVRPFRSDLVRRLGGEDDVSFGGESMLTCEL